MIAQRLSQLLAQLPEGVGLVAVSKLKPASDIEEAYLAGQRAFGENYAAELRDKQPLLPGDIQWHHIGHLQPKQLKYYISFVTLIHGVDTMDHLLAVERAAARVGRTVDVLLQVHVAEEATKFGFAPDELRALSDAGRLAAETTPHLRIRGLMGMATHTDEKQRIRDDFRQIRLLFEQLRAGAPSFDTLSMGMSHDWPIAVDEGSTLVRIGSAIFGPRS